MPRATAPATTELTQQTVATLLAAVDENLIFGVVRVHDAFLDGCPKPARRALEDFRGGVIVVFALPITDIGLWLWYAAGDRRFVFANHILERAANALIADCQRQGVPYCDVARVHPGVVSLVALGESAGLGRRGRNNLLLHPVHGSWLQLHAVAMGRETEASPPAIENPCISCFRCIVACPAKAISGRGFSAERCTRFVASFWMPRSKARALSPNTYVECNACISACPVAQPPTGLAAHEVSR